MNVKICMRRRYKIVLIKKILCQEKFIGKITINSKENLKIKIFVLEIFSQSKFLYLKKKSFKERKPLDPYQLLNSSLSSDIG